MSERQGYEYKETIDYAWVLSRAIDRAAAARASVYPGMMKVEYQRALQQYRAALAALYAILPPGVRGRVGDPLRAERLRDLDAWLAGVIAELDRAKLLLRKSSGEGVREPL